MKPTKDALVSSWPSAWARNVRVDVQWSAFFFFRSLLDNTRGTPIKNRE